MKKGLEKLISIILLVLGTILIVFLALAVFGKLDEATMSNEVVRTMILGLALVFLVCAIVMIAASFKDTDVLKSVVLSSERASTTRVSLSVIRKVVAKNAKYISGLKVSGVALQLDENNAIRMKLTVKILGNDVDFVVDRFRCLLFDAFYAVLGVEFSSIDFKVKALSPKYAPDMNKVDRAAAEIKEKREKLMLQKLKMEEEESKFEEERKAEADKRRREEARARREREEARKNEHAATEVGTERLEDIADGAEEVPVYVIRDDFSMPENIAEDAAIKKTETANQSGAAEKKPNAPKVSVKAKIAIKSEDATKAKIAEQEDSAAKIEVAEAVKAKTEGTSISKPTRKEESGGAALPIITETADSAIAEENGTKEESIENAETEGIAQHGDMTNSEPTGENLETDGVNVENAEAPTETEREQTGKQTEFGNELENKKNQEE